MDQAPAYTPNVRMNNPSGDISTDGQSNTAVSPWGRFAVSVWSDSKPVGGSVSTPPFTLCGYGISCDFGATWTDGGDFPRTATDQTMEVPHVANDGRGRFYAVAGASLGLDGSGNASQYAIALWIGTLDSTTCAMNWSAPQFLHAGTDIVFYPRVVADPYDDHVSIAYNVQGSVDEVHVLNSADRGQTWGSSVRVDPGSWGRPESPDIAVGPDHALYVVWSNLQSAYWCDMSNPSAALPVILAKSTDHGATWSWQTVADSYSTFYSQGQANIWGWHVTLPRVAVDRSNGPYRGRVYVTWPASNSWAAPSGLGTSVAESEPNALPSQALAVTLGQDATGTIANSADRDFWKINLAAGDVMLARLEPGDFTCGGSTTNGMSIRMFANPLDPSVAPLDTVLQTSSSATWFAQVVFTCKTTGTYYLRLLNNTTAATNVAYTLKTRRIMFTASPPATAGRDEGDILIARADGATAPWSYSIVNATGPTGYNENGPSVDVDGSGRVRVVWLDHRETEATPRTVLQGHLTDLYMGTSTDGGATFGAGDRISDESGVFFRFIRVFWGDIQFHGDVRSDGDHVYAGWDDLRLSTRAVSGQDAWSQFIDHESPRISYQAGPAEGGFSSASSASLQWTGVDRRSGYAGNTYRWELVRATEASSSGSVVASAALSTDSSAVVDSGSLGTDGRYDFKVYGRDAAGNEAILPTTRRFWVDRAAPALSLINAPGQGATVSTPAVTFSGLVLDNLDVSFTNNVLAYAVEVDGVRGANVPIANGAVASRTLNDLTAGSHQVKIWVRDATGNEALGLDRTFNYEIPAPTSPYAAIDAPPTFNWTQTPAAASSYRLEIATAPDAGAIVQTVNTAATSYIYSAATAGQTLYARVSASGDGGATFFGTSSWATPVLIFGPGAYRWNVASGSWSAPGSWYPARTSTSYSTHVLTFDGDALAAGSITRSPTVTSVPNGPVGQLRVVNACSPTFSSGVMRAGTGTISRTGNAVTGSGTLFLTQLSLGDVIRENGGLTSTEVTAIASNTALTSSVVGTLTGQGFTIAPRISLAGPGAAFLIEAASSLTIASTEPVSIYLATGATGSIAGGLTLQGTLHRLHAADAHSIEVTGSVTTQTGFSGSAFTSAGPANILDFKAGSSFYQHSGANPFGLTAPGSKVVFEPGSNYVLKGNLLPSLSNRTYANFIYDTGFSITSTAGVSMWTMDSLRIVSGAFIVSAALPVTVKGALSTAGGAFTYSPTASGNFTFAGTSAQRIEAPNALTFGPNSHVRINNAAGVELASGTLTAHGSFDFLQGVVSGSGTVAIPGTLTGAGSGTGWFACGERLAIASGGSSRTFHLGDVSNYTPVEVSFSGVASGFDLTSAAHTGVHPQLGASPLESEQTVQRWFSLTPSGSPSLSYSPTFHFIAGDLPAGAAFDSLAVARYDGTWHMTTAGTRTATSTQATGLTSFSDFAIGELEFYRLSVTTAGSGSVARSPDDSTHIAGSTVTLTPTPASGWSFSAWSGDASGNANPLPLVMDADKSITATFADATAPETEILTGPAEGSTIGTATPSFTFTGTDNLTATGSLQFATVIDGNVSMPFGPATSETLAPLGDGAHTFAVKARDEALNEDATPATRTFTVRAQVPVVSFTDGPAEGGFSDADTTLAWSAALSSLASGATYAYSLDGAPYTSESAATSVSLTGLAAGSHTITVRATDDASLQGSATRTWTVDLTAPTVSIDRGPADSGYSPSADARFGWSGSDAEAGGVEFSYRLDAGDWTAFSIARSIPVNELSSMFGMAPIPVRPEVAERIARRQASTVTRLMSASTRWYPADPLEDGTLTISYDPVAGTLPDIASPVYLHIGHSGWTNVVAPDPVMTFDADSARWFYTYDIPAGATSVDFVFTDGIGNWDNNGGADWHVPVASSTTLPYTMDGTLDAGVPSIQSCLGHSALWNLHAEYDGRWLYVAVPREWAGHDFFVTVTKPATIGTRQAPWVKAGTFAQWDLLLANEESTNFAAWFDPNEVVLGSGDLRKASGAVLEGLVDLQAIWGTAPATVSIGATGFSSPDGGGLLTQVPCGDGDGSVERAEWVSLGVNTVSYAGLSESSHVFQVKGRDAVGNESSSASRTWRIDLTAPETEILSGPGEGSTQSTASATLTFSGTDDVSDPDSLRYAWRVDAGAYTPISSATTANLSALADGPHTFDVKAYDLAGNEDPTPAARSWTVHAQIPVVTFTDGPAEGGFSDADTTLAWSVTLSPLSTSATYAYSLDGAPYTSESAATSVTLSGLAVGSHTLTVRATDDANLQGTATRTWTVDLTAPVVSIASGPADSSFVNTTEVQFGWSVSDPGGAGGITSAYRLYGGGWSAYTASTLATLSGLSVGPHVFELRVRDAVGNETGEQSCDFDVTGLVSWWRAEDDASDSWGGNEGTAQGALTYVPSATGKAFALDGSTAYVQVPASASLLPGTGSFTVEAWVRTSVQDYLPVSFVAKVDRQTGAGLFRSLYTLELPDGFSPSFRVKAAANVQGIGNAATDQLNLVDVWDGAWHHLVGMRDMASGSLEIFVDGVLTDSVAIGLHSGGNLQDQSTPDPLVIGGAYPPGTGGVSKLWPGEIDEVVYSNRALTNAEISANYTTSGRSACASTGLAQRQFTVDLGLPDTQILTGPDEGSTQNVAGATLTFTGSDDHTGTGNLQYAWRVGAGAFSAYSSATSASPAGLSDATHTFEVKARDQAGNDDPTPATRSWTVHAQLPVVTFTDGPAEGGFSDADTTLAWSGAISPLSTSVTYATKLDGGAFSSESGATTLALAGLAPGPHTLIVRATDNAGLVGTATRNWTVDVTSPSVAFTAGPADGGFSNITTPAFTWSGSDGGSGGIQYGYRTDGGAWSEYTAATNVTLPALSEGSHQFDVRARDAVGNETSLSCTFSTTGLVSWWPADGSAADAWGTNGGILMYGASFATGQRGQAFSFDGVDDYVRVPNGANLHPRTGSFTLEAWIRTTQSTTGVIATNYECQPGCTGSFSSNFQLSVNAAKVELFVRDSDGGGDYSDGQLIVSTGSVTDGNWHHVVAQRDQSDGDLRIYLDGTLDATAPLNPGATGDIFDEDGEDDPLMLGAQFGNGVNGLLNTYSGEIDEVAFTTRALSAAEISAIHAAGGRTACTAAASRAWTVDTTPPTSDIVGGPGDGSTVITSSVTLLMEGSDNFTPEGQLRYEWRVNGGAWSAPVASSSVLVTGLFEATFLIEVRSRDLADNVDASPAARTLTVHVLPPSKFLIAGPPDYSTQTTAAFAFSSVGNQPANTIQYSHRMDSGAWSAFSPDTTASYPGLAEGSHAFRLRARDAFGLEDSTQATFAVDFSAPNTFITSGPANNGWSGSTSVTFGFGASDNLTPAGLLLYEWSADGGPWSPPSSETSALLTGLAPGSHTFAVRATDPAGHTDSSPAQNAFTVDLGAPETQLLSGPAEGSIVTASSVSFSWTGSDAAAPVGQLAFATRADGAGFGGPSAATGTSLNGLGDGPHSFEVRAHDPAGNVDATPESRAWITDAQGPAITITAGPTPGQCQTALTADFEWIATDVVSPQNTLVYAYALDGAPPTAFGTVQSVSLNGLAEGVHTFTVQARDERGHVTSLARLFRVDLTPPVALAATTRLLDNSTVRVNGAANDDGGVTGYRVQVATDPGFAAITHDVTVGVSGQFDFGGVAGNTYYARVAATDCAGNDGSFGPVSNGTTVNFLPDLVVTNVDTPPTVTAGQVMQVDFTVGNPAIGATTTPQWFDDLYLSPTPTFDIGTAIFLARVQNLTYLSQGETYTSTTNVTVPLGLEGSYRVIAIADNGGAVPETNGGNNGGVSPPIAVALGTYGDLQVTRVVVPPTAFSGDPVTVEWTVSNEGTGPTNASQWYDTILFSDDSTFSFILPGSSNIRVFENPVANYLHTGTLAAGASYTRTETVNVPAGVAGRKFFYVVTDLRVEGNGQTLNQRGSVFEHVSELNNWTAAGGMDVTLTPPPDLVVTNVTASPTGNSGVPIAVSWTVRNSGFNPTPDQVWTDRVYLSTDAALDGGDPVLGALSRSGALGVTATYTLSGSFTLPQGISGPRHLIVYTDIYGQLGEYLEGNNAGATSSATAVTLSPYADLVPSAGSAPDTAAAGGGALLLWTVNNAGPATLSGSWQDDLYLSPSPTWNPGNAVRVSVVGVARTVAPGQDYSMSTTVGVPTHLSGLQYVYVVADARNDVYEYTHDDDNLKRVGSVFVTPYPPVDLAASGLTVPAGAVSTSGIPITWSVTNQGQGATLASSWPQQVWLSADNLFQPASDIFVQTTWHGGALAPGAGYTHSTTPTFESGFGGTYYVVVRVDPGLTTGDFNASNNLLVSAAPVTISPLTQPNLRVPAVQAPLAGVAGQPGEATFSVLNDGAASLTGSTWFWTGYLSQDGLLDAGDLVLGSKQGRASLGSGAAYQDTLPFTYPGFAAGGYRVLIQADSRGDLAESNESDNVGASPGGAGISQVTLPPPADLVVEDVLVPATATPGQPVLVSWTLRNLGPNPASGYLQNAVYMSADASFESEHDPLVGIQTVFVTLPVGGVQRMSALVELSRPIEVSSSGELIGTLPPLSPGPYYSLVRTNVRNNIRETSASNNLGSSAVTLEALVAELILDVPQTTATALDEARFYRVSVLAGKDLRFSTATNVPDAVNEMYVAYGRVPSLTDFDLSGPAGFVAAPDALVPGTAAGTYFVMVVNRGLGAVATSEDLTVKAEVLPFSIASVTPNHGGQDGRVTSRLRGAQFRASTVVRLEQGGLPLAAGTISRLVSSAEMDVRWNLDGVPLGVYDVVAVNDAEVVVAPNAFTVEPAVPMTVVVDAFHADVLRRTATSGFTLRFRNGSNVDIPVLRARVLFPGSSLLRGLRVSDGLQRRSDRMPAAFAAVTGDVSIVYAPSGDSLAIVDLWGADLRAGEQRTVTLDLAGYVTSPYSVRALAQPMTVTQFLDRSIAEHEVVRRAVLANPGAVAPATAELAADVFAFRDSALLALAGEGLVTADEALEHLLALPPGEMPDTAVAGGDGPPELIAQLASEDCTVPMQVPECQPDVATLASALPGCVAVFRSAIPVVCPVGGGLVAPMPVGTTQGFVATTSADARVVTPCDPNILTGPAGYGDQHWVNANEALPYRIDFENLSGVASAPAQVVSVRLPLDSDLDPTSFRLVDVGFGSHVISVPPDRTTYTVEPYFSDLGLRVRVVAGVDIVAHEAFWTLTSIDPATGMQPTNPYIGFLPPNDPTGKGAGYATFTIRPHGTGPSGAQVNARASIKFDANVPILTVEAVNRVDSRLPSSAVQPVATVFDSTRVRLQWTSRDDSTGAGVASVALYQRQDSGVFTLCADGLPGTQAEVAVAAGHVYAFYTLATDNTGNTEPPKTAPEIQVVVGTVLGAPPPAPPLRTQLLAPYPNPFRGATTLRFDLARAEKVTIEIFDVQGRAVARPVVGKLYEAGAQSVRIDRPPGAPGLYFYRFRAGTYSAIRRMVLVR